jgi:hypothetical protein
MEEDILLFNSKEGINFYRKSNVNWYITLEIKNDNIILPNIINFDLFYLLFDINKEIYEISKMYDKTDESATIFNLPWNHFKDWGIPQRYNYIDIQKTIKDNIIFFNGVTSSKTFPKEIILPETAKPLPLKHFNTSIEVVTNHHLKIKQEILLDLNINLPPFIEKLIAKMGCKIFIKFKKFIEDVKI